MCLILIETTGPPMDCLLQRSWSPKCEATIFLQKSELEMVRSNPRGLLYTKHVCCPQAMLFLSCMWCRHTETATRRQSQTERHIPPPLDQWQGSTHLQDCHCQRNLLSWSLPQHLAKTLQGWEVACIGSTHTHEEEGGGVWTAAVWKRQLMEPRAGEVVGRDKVQRRKGPRGLAVATATWNETQHITIMGTSLEVHGKRGRGIWVGVEASAFCFILTQGNIMRF